MRKFWWVPVRQGLGHIRRIWCKGQGVEGRWNIFRSSATQFYIVAWWTGELYVPRDVQDFYSQLEWTFETTLFRIGVSSYTQYTFTFSDVLANQIIKMDYDDRGMCVIANAEKPSFAANIHSIMADCFFLKYTIGEQARLCLTEKLGLFKDMWHVGNVCRKQTGKKSPKWKNCCPISVTSLFVIVLFLS